MSSIHIVWLLHTAGLDFSMITDSLLTLNATCPNATITISILNDNVLESTESFTVNLAFSGGPVPRVILSPSTATVTILDDDGKQVQLMGSQIVGVDISMS